MLWWGWCLGGWLLRRLVVKEEEEMGWLLYYVGWLRRLVGYYDGGSLLRLFDCSGGLMLVPRLVGCEEVGSLDRFII